MKMIQCKECVIGHRIKCLYSYHVVPDVIGCIAKEEES